MYQSYVKKDGTLLANRLVLASISYMLYGALKDNIGDESEETVTIIIPEASAGDMKTYLHKVYKCQSLQMFPNIKVGVVA